MSSTSVSSLLKGDVQVRGLWSDAFRRFRQNRGAVIGLGVVLFMVLVAIVAPVMATHDPIAQEWGDALAPPSVRHFFGADQYGRDVYSRVVYGSRISLRLGLISVSVACVVGIPIGLLAGYYVGWLDILIMRVVDIMLAFPGLLLALAIMSILGPSLTNTMIAVGLSLVPDYIRISRGSTLSVRQMDYVTAARAIGSSNARIMVHHVLPNVVLPLIILTSLDIAGAILSISGLSFLGLGAQPPIPEWGAMLTHGRNFIQQAWWLTIFPGLAIMIAVLTMNLVGEGLRDALDPRLTIEKR